MTGFFPKGEYYKQSSYEKMILDKTFATTVEDVILPDAGVNLDFILPKGNIKIQLDKDDPLQEKMLKSEQSYTDTRRNRGGTIVSVLESGVSESWIAKTSGLTEDVSPASSFGSKVSNKVDSKAEKIKNQRQVSTGCCGCSLM